MKKAISILFFLIITFILLVYWSLNTKPDVYKTSKIVDINNVDSIDFKTLDSVVITASTQYEGDELKTLMQGEHYRNAWSTPIKVPVVFLDTLFGGVTILEEGGGKQTQSLKLKAKNGLLYTLRSIDKDPTPLIPAFAKTLGLENIIIDGVSAQHPYGAIVVAQLAKKAGILQTNPLLVFVPKQPNLATFNEVYGNRLYLLEHETESKINWTFYKDVNEIIDTDELQKLKLTHKNRLPIHKRALLRARLFDLVIGDWDRHAKQWGWVIQQKDSNMVAIPLPVDRDNAFFNISGVIPSLIANKNVVPEMQAFQDEIDYLPGLVQSFDVYFLLNTPESIFIEEAKQLQALLTDEAIEQALHKWPKEFYDLDGKAIASKLKSRREKLVEYALAFKKVLDKKALLTEPLNGSEDLNLPKGLIACFECDL